MMARACGGFGHTLGPTDKRLCKSCPEDREPRNCLLVRNLLFCLVTAHAGTGPVPCRGLPGPPSDTAGNPELSPTPKTLQRTQSSAQHQRRCSDPRAQPNTKDAAGRTRSGIILLLKDCLEVPQAWIHGSFPGLTETAIFLPCPESCSTVAEGRALEDPEEGCFLSVVLRAASSFRLGPVS